MQKKAGASRPTAQIALNFRPCGGPNAPGTDLHLDISAIARRGDALFLSSDESAGVERLNRAAEGWSAHRHFTLAEFFKLPGGANGEMDIEGLAIDDHWLWVMGSQALKRKRPKSPSPKKALKQIRKVEFDANRQFIGRLPLVAGAGGCAPVSKSGKRRAAHFRFRAGGALRKWLRNDRLLGPYLDLPGKENGLDLEGIAAKGMRVWVGLRGPVLRGYAVVLEMILKETGAGYLKPRRIDGRRRYRTHLLPAAGQGIRDLTVDGADLVLLTGTSLANDGPASILRWQGALDCRASGVQPADALSPVRELPARRLIDNPEGLQRWEDGWLVLHDSPHPDRLRWNPPGILADYWADAAR